MTQRWFAVVLLECEQSFNRVRGYKEIPDLVARIEEIKVKDGLGRAA